LYIGLKTWRRDNRDEARRRDRNWKNKNRDRVRSNYRARYARNPKKFVDKTKRYYKQNSECVRARRIKYHYTIYRDAEVRQRAAARTRRWVKEHPDRVKVNARNGKAKRKNVAGVHTAADIANILTLQKSKCAVCRTSLADKYHIDHIVPVKLGGTNDRANLQILCIACNLQKGARDPIDHMRSLGKLL
jgi:5-methylcytosine-specific restriction endonuclease McrA